MLGSEVSISERAFPRTLIAERNMCKTRHAPRDISPALGQLQREAMGFSQSHLRPAVHASSAEYCRYLGDWK